MTPEELFDWRPDNRSEDHLTSTLATAAQNANSLVLCYSNPPSGEWGSFRMKRDGQLLHRSTNKRGRGRIKRPDVVVQPLAYPTHLIPIECKTVEERIDDDIDEEMVAFFEGRDDYNGVLNGLFWNDGEKRTNPFADTSFTYHPRIATFSDDQNTTPYRLTVDWEDDLAVHAAVERNAHPAVRAAMETLANTLHEE